MKSIVITIVLFPVWLYSQSSILSTGGDGSGPGGWASISIGQVFDNSWSNSTILIQEGIQQNLLFDTDGLIEMDFNKIVIYPVPTLNEISFDFKELNDIFEYELFSIDGVVKDKGGVSINNPSINLEKLASGEYFLILYTDKYFHKSKITKI
jgi:hypothetical protein